jgi:hypothetical protein
MGRLLFVSISCLAIAAGSARAQTLWQGTKAGMTEEQVKALYPAAKLGGDYLVVEGVQIFNQSFNALFKFDGGRLTEVSLTAGSILKPKTPNDFLATYAEVGAELTRKYGPAVRSEDPGILGMIGKRMSRKEEDFLSGRTSIRLTYMDTTNSGGGDQVTVDYTSATGGDEPL